MDRVAIVTGSSSGIGLAIAKNLANSGVNVVLNGRDTEKLKVATVEVGGNAAAVAADVFSEEGCDRLVCETIQRFGRLDILVNNAATVGVGQPVETLPVETFDAVIAGNLRSVFLMCRAAIPHIKQQTAGRIVNIGGLSAKNPLPFAAADAAAKAGVLALTRTLAAELGRAGVTVNAVMPGLHADTPLGAEFNERLSAAFHISPEDAVNATLARTLSKRFETLEEVGQTVAFLCSDAAAAITGQTLNVNCGLATY